MEIGRASIQAGSISYHESGSTAWEKPVVCRLAMTGLPPANQSLVADVTARRHYQDGFDPGG